MAVIELTPENKQIYTVNAVGAVHVYLRNGKTYIATTESSAVLKGTPKFKHDCTQCLFLRTFHRFDQWYDLYFCDSIPELPTVIARHGDKGHEYLSGLGSSLVPLEIAEDMCRWLGLLPATKVIHV